MREGRKNDEAGFTLVEVIVALAILALSLSVLLGTISNTAWRSAQAEKLTRAGSLAQSLLARAGTEMSIREGETTGEFPGGFRWRLIAQRYDDSVARIERRLAGAQSGLEWNGGERWPVAAYTVSVEVFWEDGFHERSVVLTTLRLGTDGPGR
jgi:general secretion pathway protein I